MSGMMDNTPAWYSALAEISACLFYVCLLEKDIWNRRHVVRYIGLSVLVLAHALYFLLSVNVYRLIGRFFMAGAVFIMLLYFVIGYEAGWKKRWFYTIHAFVLAEFLASMAWQVSLLFSWQNGTERELPLWGEIVFVVLAYGAVLFILWKLERRTVERVAGLQVSSASLLACLMIGLGTYVAGGLGPDLASEMMTGRFGLAIFGIRTLIDFAGVVMLYAHTMQLYTVQISQENYAVHALLERQAQQYRFSQECIDMVNMKYHDLKQQINRWKLEADGAGHEAYLEQLSDQIGQFDLRVDTGNPAVDIIMTEKSIKCADRKIQLTMVIDGKELGFIKEDDLSSVFGNAMDNAIEYEEKIAEQNKRLIHVTVNRVQDFMMMIFENYCPTTVVRGEALPETTKKDRNYHGFGLRSIRYIAQKYHGEADVSQDDNWFHLKILIPIPDK